VLPTCTATIRPYSEDVPYHANFEMHRCRFTEIGDMLADHDIVGAGVQAAASHREGHGTCSFTRLKRC
jgi:hypothetical protein